MNYLNIELPDAYDMRTSHLSSMYAIQDQKTCGSCLIYACTNMLQTRFNRIASQDKIELDGSKMMICYWSEQDVVNFYQLNMSERAKVVQHANLINSEIATGRFHCDEGLSLNNVLRYLRQFGITTKSCTYNAINSNVDKIHCRDLIGSEFNTCFNNRSESVFSIFVLLCHMIWFA